MTFCFQIVEQTFYEPFGFCDDVCLTLSLEVYLQFLSKISNESLREPNKDQIGLCRSLVRLQLVGNRRDGNDLALYQSVLIIREVADLDVYFLSFADFTSSRYRYPFP